MKLLAERDLAPEQLARWSVSDADTPALAARVAERRTRLEALVAVPKLPVRDIQVKLRHREGPLASYAVTVDRFDPQTVTLARYSMILSDEQASRSRRASPSWWRRSTSTRPSACRPRCSAGSPSSREGRRGRRGGARRRRPRLDARCSRPHLGSRCARRPPDGPHLLGLLSVSLMSPMSWWTTPSPPPS